MQLTLSPTPPCSFWESQPFQTGQSGQPSPHQCLLSIHSKGSMLEDNRVAFLILAALNWAMQVQSVIPLDPAARSHRPFSMSDLLPNLAKTGESQHTNCLWSWVLLDGWRHTSYENNCVQVYKGLLSASPTHLAFVRFLKPLAKADQTTLLHWSQLAQISLNVISIQFISWKKKKNNSEDTWHSQKGDVELFLHIRLLMIYTGRAQKP